MQVNRQSRYLARVATTEAELVAAQALRFRCFHAGDGINQVSGGRDEDAFDAICLTYLIEDRRSGNLVGTFRVLPLASGREIARTYSAQFYHLDGFTNVDAPLMELGRFCVAPEVMDPEVLRVAWGALTELVDLHGAEFVFGCSSFFGVDPEPYSDAFAMLRERHLAPRRFLPRIKAPRVLRYAAGLAGVFDRARALKTMPPLLRSYLSMNGWVSDHAVVDTDMNTLHVFTGLEVARIPAARARVLRAVAG